MKRSVLAVGVLGLALSLAAVTPTSAGPGSNRGKKNVTVSGQVTASPNALSSPITPDSHMQVCVSGFAEGSFVGLSVPWVGTVDSHSYLSFSKYVDATGGFCVSCPPDWATISLAPGTYTIESYWYTDGGSGDRRTGPTGSFVVNSTSTN